MLNHTPPLALVFLLYPLPWFGKLSLRRWDAWGFHLWNSEGSWVKEWVSYPSGVFSSSLDPRALCLIYTFFFLPAEVEFNVSEAFVPLTTPNSNHSSHTGNDPVDSGTLERKRPASMAVMEGDLVKKERCVQSCGFSRWWEMAQGSWWTRGPCSRQSGPVIRERLSLLPGLLESR